MPDLAASTVGSGDYTGALVNVVSLSPATENRYGMHVRWLPVPVVMTFNPASCHAMAQVMSRL